METAITLTNQDIESLIKSHIEKLGFEFVSTKYVIKKKWIGQQHNGHEELCLDCAVCKCELRSRK